MKMRVMASKGVFLMLVLSVLLILTAIQPVIAVDTEIIVKTLPHNKVSVQVLDPAQVYALLNSYHVYATETGKVSVIYSGSEEKINLKVTISKNGTPVKFDGKEFQLFEKYDTGNKIYILMMDGEKVSISYDDFDKPPVPVENITNTTAVNETNQVNQTEKAGIEEENNSSSLTGNAIVRNFQSNKKAYLYVIFGVFGSAIILFAGFLVRKRIINRPQKEIKVTKLSKINLDSQEPPKSNFPDRKLLERAIQEKEAKLREAEAEIIRLKNQNKIDEIERRMAEERKEIERLRKGGELDLQKNSWMR